MKPTTLFLLAAAVTAIFAKEQCGGNAIKRMKTRLDTLSQKTFQLSRDLSDVQLVAAKCYSPVDDREYVSKMITGWINNKHLEDAVKLGLAYYNDNEKDMDELKKNEALNGRMVFVMGEKGNEQAHKLVVKGFNELMELGKFLETTNGTTKHNGANCDSLNPEIGRMTSRVSVLTNKLLKSVRDLADAQLISGDCYYRNFEDTLAIQMYTDSANYGNTHAMLKLSGIYSSHPNEDKVLELEYLHRAAQLGNQEAQQWLVKFYKGKKGEFIWQRSWFWQQELEKANKNQHSSRIEL